MPSERNAAWSRQKVYTVDEKNSVMPQVGGCFRVIDRHLDDILLVESGNETATRFSGTFLSTGEKVRLLVIKNHSGLLHVQRAKGETVHLDSLSPRLQSAEVLGWMLEQKRRLKQDARATQARAAAFNRNCKSFQKKMDSPD